MKIGSDQYNPLYDFLKIMFEKVELYDEYLIINDKKVEIKRIGNVTLLHPVKPSLEELIPLPDVTSLVTYGNKKLSFVELLLKKYVKSNKLLCYTVLELARNVKVVYNRFPNLRKVLITAFLILLEKELFPVEYWILRRILRELMPKNSYEKIIEYVKLIEGEKKKHLGFINNQMKIGNYWAKVYEINNTNEQFMWKIIKSKIEQITLSD